ncbi:hypothetical protein BC628DRAFT_711916 [Trametes gibbosa]|nr:hypothetical protein BC628DRAFT_711916 [Trametes gibbosa]
MSHLTTHIGTGTAFPVYCPVCAPLSPFIFPYYIIFAAMFMTIPVLVLASAVQCSRPPLSFPHALAIPRFGTCTVSQSAHGVPANSPSSVARRPTLFQCRLLVRISFLFVPLSCYRFLPPPLPRLLLLFLDIVLSSHSLCSSEHGKIGIRTYTLRPGHPDKRQMAPAPVLRIHVTVPRRSPVHACIVHMVVYSVCIDTTRMLDGPCRTGQGGTRVWPESTVGDLS